MAIGKTGFWVAVAPWVFALLAVTRVRGFG